MEQTQFGASKLNGFLFSVYAKYCSVASVVAFTIGSVLVQASAYIVVKDIKAVAGSSEVSLA